MSTVLLTITVLFILVSGFAFFGWRTSRDILVLLGLITIALVLAVLSLLLT